MKKKHNPQVSILVATFNSNNTKLLQTLKMACKQKNIDYEIIVTDDGSKEFDKQFIIDYFTEVKFGEFSIIENKENVGTINNLLNASRIAKGEYLFFTSPGDILYDENTLKTIYDYAKQNNCKICFGDYIEYCQHGNDIKILHNQNWPNTTEVYGKKQKIYKTDFCFGDYVTGSSIIREKDYAIKSMKYISEIVKYTEDNTTMCYAMAQNQKICYLDKKIVWYDRGEGISAEKNTKWAQVIWDELKLVKESLIKDYPTDKILKTGFCAYYQKYGKWTNILLLLKHPIICFRKQMIKRMKKHQTLVSKEEKQKLMEILSVK